jgi:hypothetical protein
MSDAEREYWEGYARSLLEPLAMVGWDVRVSDVPCEGAEAVTIECIEGQRVAFLRFSEEWGTFSDEDRRTYLSHELHHIPFTQMRFYIWNTLERLLGKRTFRAWWAGFHLLFEYGVDHVARTAAARLPLPPEMMGAVGSEE